MESHGFGNQMQRPSGKTQYLICNYKEMGSDGGQEWNGDHISESN